MNTLKFARFFATVKHAGQLYGGCLPYTHHLAAVEAVVRRFGYGSFNRLDEEYETYPVDNEDVGSDLLPAAWLHDVREDCGVKIKEIRELFGEGVARLVDAVTDEPGENRKTRKALTYPKIRATVGATVIKLADRIANIEHGGMVDMYRKEYADFKHALFVSGECVAMWAYLDELLEE